MKSQTAHAPGHMNVWPCEYQHMLPNYELVKNVNE